MKPYIHATGVRGEGFRCDNISDLDQYATQQAALNKALENHPKKERGVKVFFSRLLKRFRKIES